MTHLELIRAALANAGVSFREVHHEPTFTSEESARARGEDVRIGGKALVIKVDDKFALFVLSAAKKLDSGALKAKFGAKKTRFATPEELKSLTGLVPGSVPPFGGEILPFELYADPSVLENEKIAFNAGSLTDSIILATSDWVKVAAPSVFRFAQAD